MKTQEIFSEGVSKSKEFFQRAKLKEFFQRSFVESAVENFKAGVRFFEEAQDTQGSFEEGGIRIQENSPKSGGREETKTK